MADRTMNDSNPNQTMRKEQAKAEVSGSSDRQREQGMDKNREKSAIGGGSGRDQRSQDKSRDTGKSHESASRF